MDDAARDDTMLRSTAPLHRPSIERRVAAFRMESIDRDPPWLVEIEDHEIRLQARLELAGGQAQKISAGRCDRAPSTRSSGTLPL